MYYRLIIIFCLLTPSILFSQLNRGEIKNQIDGNGLKQGEWEVKHENSNAIRYKGQFKDDLPFGKFQYYYPTGEISGIMNFYDLESSFMKMYHKNGFLMSAGKYINQKKDSIWWYFNAQQEVLSTENYSNGMLDGEQITYFPFKPDQEKAQIMEEQIWVNGVKHGSWQQYYKIGRIKSEGSYVKGHLEGVVKYYYSTGKLEIQAFYKKGLKNGFWFHFEQDGSVKEKVCFKEDRILKGKELEKHLKKLKAEKAQK